jgi:hypothetical protein
VGRKGKEEEIESKWPTDLKFGRMILDEGHMVKDTDLRAHFAMKSIPCDARVIVAATLMFSKMPDIKGFLSILSRGEFEVTMQLRRTVGHKVYGYGGESIIIGADIPACRVKTVECQMTASQLKEYKDVHDRLAAHLKQPGNAAQTSSTDEVGGQFDMTVYRRLCHLSVSLGLERMFVAAKAKSGNLDRDIAKWKGISGLGIPYFLTRMIRDVAIPSIPVNRESIALIMVNLSAKLKYLLPILLRVVIQARKKLLLVCRHAMVQYFLECFLRILGFRFASIHAGMSSQEREKVCGRFNDLGSDLDILPDTYTTTVGGLNLHEACHHTVLFEPAVNAGQQLQSISRTHRLGQKHGQTVYILSGTNTFDRFVESNQTRKFLAQLEGSCSIGVERDENGSTVDLNARGAAVITALFGQEKSRLPYTDFKDLGLTALQVKRISRQLKLSDGFISRSEVSSTPRKKQAELIDSDLTNDKNTDPSYSVDYNPSSDDDPAEPPTSPKNTDGEPSNKPPGTDKEKATRFPSDSYVHNLDSEHSDIALPPGALERARKRPEEFGASQAGPTKRSKRA